LASSLLLGFAGAMRRSELVGLNVNDLKDTKAGLRLYIRTSKTDQDRLGQIVAIAPGKIVCPVKALRAWISAAKITSGPIFRPIFNGGHVSTNRLPVVRDVLEEVGNQRIPGTTGGQRGAFPSHGRGHRFNPYSAHHLTL
jgi:integrase